MYDFYSQFVRQPRTVKLLLVMKLTTLIMILAIMQVSAITRAQKVTLSVKNAPLISVLQQLRSQTGFDFAYKTKTLENATSVSITVNNQELKNVLDAVFDNQPLSYVIEEKTVVITQKTAKVLEGTKTALAPIDVTGRVTDENNQPIPGATVKIKNGSQATSTDKDGDFTLRGVNDNSIIVVSVVGYISRELLAKSQLGTIRLTVANTNLQEVIINKGYYTETLRTSVGNVGSVTAKDIEDRPVSNLLTTLQGRIPGLFINQSTGLPGSGITVRIQGLNSIERGNDPLFVIDGVPFISQNLPGNLSGILGNSGGAVIDGNAPGSGNPLSYFSPNDIESIQVLKDADATAIYGSRAANGVILITTKKGKAGKTSVSLDVQSGWGKIIHPIQLLNTDQFITLRKEAKANDKGTISATDYDINGFWDNKRYTDWQKELIGRSAQFNNAQINISGGDKNTQFMIGGGFNRQTTVFPGDFADRKSSLHVNLNNNSDDNKFKIQLSANYIYDNNHLPQADPTNQALILAPDAPPLYNANGTLNWMPNSSGNSTWNNPLAALLNTLTATNKNLLSNLIMSYQFTPKFSFKTSLGYNNLITNEFTANPLTSTAPEKRANTNRGAGYLNNEVSSYNIEPQLNYETRIGKGTLSALLGTTILRTSNSVQQLFGSGYTSDQVLNDIKSAASITSGLSFNSVYRYNAGFARINYNLSDKYLINITGRRDGSSRFGEHNRLHNFGAIGLGWVFSEESFGKDIGFLSFGKLRGSYGTSGNDQIGDYQYLYLYNSLSAGVPYQNIPGLQPGGLPNYDLQWEETKKLQGGIDLNFLKDKLQFSLTYVRNTSSNQLLAYALPNITGFSSIYQNFPAIVRNTAWELSLTTLNLSGRNFKWNTSLNLTIPKNKLIRFDDLQSSTYASYLKVGESVSVFNGYKFAGVNPTTGLYQFVGKDGTITSTVDPSNDMTEFIDLLPRFYGGLQNTVTFKDFRLDFLFQFVRKNAPNYKFGNIYNAYAKINQPASLFNRWQSPGDITTIQKVSSNFSTIGQQSAVMSSDATYGDASYIRLKDISFSWQLKRAWAQKLHLNSCSVYLQGQNLITITNYYGLDPETASSTTLPPLKTITLGIKASL